MNFTKEYSLKTFNQTENENVQEKHKLTKIDIILACIPLFVIVVGLTGNTISFIIFRFEKDLKNISSMVYLSFCCITDTLSYV